MFEFTWPLVLLLAPLPLFIYFVLPAARKHEPAALNVPFFDRIQAFSDANPQTTKGSWLKMLLFFLLWLSLLLAAAGPQRVDESIEMPMTGRDLLVAVDLSGSMEQGDMKLNGQAVERIELVKDVVSRFVERRTGDRMGLVLFGSRAYLQAPLSFDRQTMNTLLHEAQLGFAGEKTAIGDAIGLAIKRLQNRPENQRVLILLTDGANTAGEIEPRKAAKLAAQENVKIYTIGIGAESMVQRTFFGNRRINPSVDLDEGMLRALAEDTGGRYFRARDQEQLESIYATLDELEPVEQDADVLKLKYSLLHWPLLLALLLSFLFAVPHLINLFATTWANRGGGVEAIERVKSEENVNSSKKTSKNGSA